MKPMFECDRWGNKYAVGYEYKFAWGYIVLEYEYTTCDTKRCWLPCYLQQWGGDHLYQWSFGWFKRNISLRIWEFDN